MVDQSRAEAYSLALSAADQTTRYLLLWSTVVKYGAGDRDPEIEGLLDEHCRPCPIGSLSQAA